MSAMPSRNVPMSRRRSPTPWHRERWPQISRPAGEMPTAVMPVSSADMLAEDTPFRGGWSGGPEDRVLPFARASSNNTSSRLAVIEGLPRHDHDACERQRGARKPPLVWSSGDE